MPAKGDAAGVNMSFDLISHFFIFLKATREEQPEQKPNMQICQMNGAAFANKNWRWESRSEVEGGSLSRGNPHKNSVDLERLVPE